MKRMQMNRNYANENISCNRLSGCICGLVYLFLYFFINFKPDLLTRMKHGCGFEQAQSLSLLVLHAISGHTQQAGTAPVLRAHKGPIQLLRGHRHWLRVMDSNNNQQRHRYFQVTLPM